MRASSLLLLCLSLTCALAFGADTEVNAVRKAPTAKSSEAGVLKLIVKFYSVGPGVAAEKVGTTQAEAASKERTSAAAKRAGLMLAESHEMAAGMQAMQGASSEPANRSRRHWPGCAPTRRSSTPSRITGALSTQRPTTRFSRPRNGT